MTTRIAALTRPTPGADHRTRTWHRNVGFGVAVVGLLLAVVTLVANVVAGNHLVDNAAGAAETLAWSFGITTLGFGTIKFGIAVILLGILVRLWLRVESVEAALPLLRTEATDSTVATGPMTTPYGRAVGATKAPVPLPIHRMARTMWAPVLAMGLMALVAGTIVSFVWSGNAAGGSAATVRSLGAWTEGLQFLGEGMLLAGISFLLGSILASLRDGGGKVQESLGVSVKTLEMPVTAKAFVALMMLGLMVSIAQFVLYIVASGATSAESFAVWAAWLGPFRELGLGLLLAGIVMALVTIGNVLGFQFDRIKEIIATGR